MSDEPEDELAKLKRKLEHAHGALVGLHVRMQILAEYEAKVPASNVERAINRILAGIEEEPF